MASIPLPNGAQIALATTIAVATAAGHTFTEGAIILLNTGWTKADNIVVRAGGVTSGAFDIEGLNSTNAGRYPAGGGTGTARAITGWTQLPKIPTFETTGGDAKATTTSYIDFEKDFEMFTGTNPERLNLTISYAPGTPAYDALVEAHESGEVQILRMVLKNGSALYYPGQLFFNKAPTTTKDSEMVNNISIALQGEITRYAKLTP